MPRYRLTSSASARGGSTEFTEPNDEAAAAYVDKITYSGTRNIRLTNLTDETVTYLPDKPEATGE